MHKEGEISGRVWLLGDHVNTDLLHPPACFSLDEEQLKNGLRVGRERLNGEFDPDSRLDALVIVAGENFGCGSSRESSVRALFASGIKAIVAQSFGRIFYRSLVNRGIAPVVSRNLHGRVADGDKVRIFLDDQRMVLNNSEQVFFDPFDPHIKRILECGGLIAYLKKECKGQWR